MAARVVIVDSAVRFSHFTPVSSHNKMPKQKKSVADKTKKGTSDERKPEVEADDPITAGANGSINIRVLAKPGANSTAITDIGPDGVGVRLAAPPVDGEENTELIKYFSKILGVKKSDVSLDKGARSRTKCVSVTGAGLTVQSVRDKLKSEAG